METCPRCGYVDNSSSAKHRPVTAVMSIYVDPKTGKVDGAYNSDEKEITVGTGANQKKLIKQSEYKPAPEKPAAK